MICLVVETLKEHLSQQLSRSSDRWDASRNVKRRNMKRVDSTHNSRESEV